MGFWDELFSLCAGTTRKETKNVPDRMISEEDEMFLQQAKRIAEAEAERKMRASERTRNMNEKGHIVSGASWEDVLPESTLERNSNMGLGEDSSFEVRNPLLKRHFSEPDDENDEDDDVIRGATEALMGVTTKPVDAQPTFSDVLSSDTLYGNYGTTTEFVNPLHRRAPSASEEEDSNNQLPNPIAIKSIQSHTSDTDDASESSPATSPFEPGKRFRKSVHARSRSRSGAKGRRGKRRSTATRNTGNAKPPLIAD